MQDRIINQAKNDMVNLSDDDLAVALRERAYMLALAESDHNKWLQVAPHDKAFLWKSERYCDFEIKMIQLIQAEIHQRQSR